MLEAMYIGFEMKLKVVFNLVAFLFVSLAGSHHSARQEVAASDVSQRLGDPDRTLKWKGDLGLRWETEDRLLVWILALIGERNGTEGE